MWGVELGGGLKKGVKGQGKSHVRGYNESRTLLEHAARNVFSFSTIVII